MLVVTFFNSKRLRVYAFTMENLSVTVIQANIHFSQIYTYMQRCYNLTLPHNKIPDPLCQLAKKMAAPAMPLNEEFKPEAAIVNYFGSGIF